MSEQQTKSASPVRVGSAARENPLRILIVDTEDIVRDSLRSRFEMRGLQVGLASNGEEALAGLAEGPWDLVLLDLNPPGPDGLQLQRRLHGAFPQAMIVVATAGSAIDTARQAVREGAHDYLSKPFDPDELERVIRHAHAWRELVKENRRLKANIELLWRSDEIVGRSQSIRQVLDLVRSASESDSPLLVVGENGTGKELVARTIHARGHRRYMPIVVARCGSRPGGVVEEELFGHERGAFAGAQYRRQGMFELADGGSILLDGIDAASPRTQLALLRVLDERSVTRADGRRSLAVDVRMMAAADRDLEAMVREGSFCEELYCRLNVVVIRMPSLRERQEDIPVLVEHFLQRAPRAATRPAVAVAPEAMDLLVRHDWPGNVQELRNAVERAAAACRGDRVEPRDLPLGGSAAAGRLRTLADAERVHVEVMLREARWNISQAARTLDIDRVTLYNKIRRYGLQRPSE